MRKVMLCCIMCIIAVLSGGCSDNGGDNRDLYEFTTLKEEEMTSEKDGVASESDYSLSQCICTEDEGEELLFDTEKTVNILFAGNSLLGNPKTYESFGKIASHYGYSVNVMTSVYDGMSLHFQKELIKNNEMDTRTKYEQADIVILQEYGNHYDLTYNEICEIISYCRDDAVIYYYTTEFDRYDDYLKMIESRDRVHILCSGELMNKIGDMDCIPGGDYPYSDIYFSEDLNLFYPYLHENDYHPNIFSGFIAAAYTFTQLYKQDFVDYELKDIDEAIVRLIPGDSVEEKQQNYNVVVEMINQGVR